MNPRGQMKVDINGNDLLAAVQAQRNDAADSAANNAAAMAALQRRILELEAKLRGHEEKR